MITKVETTDPRAARTEARIKAMLPNDVSAVWVQVDKNNPEQKFLPNQGRVAQYVILHDQLEFVEEKNMLEFLEVLKTYAPILIATYRLNNLPERKNAVQIAVIDIGLQKAGWDILADKMISPVQKLYYCAHGKHKKV